MLYNFIFNFHIGTSPASQSAGFDVLSSSKVSTPWPCRPRGWKSCPECRWGAPAATSGWGYRWKIESLGDSKIKFWGFRARFQLYWNQILQENTRWKALAEIYTMHAFAPFSWNPSGWRNTRKVAPRPQQLETPRLQKKSAKFSAIFNEKFEMRKRCKGVHCVDLGESFPTRIYLQNLASIQPRTSLVKFARSPRTDHYYY